MDIITPRQDGVYVKLPQRVQEDVVVDSLWVLLVHEGVDKRKHMIPEVLVDSPTSTLPAREHDPILLHGFEEALLPGVLVTPNDDVLVILPEEHERCFYGTPLE
jgi:hypothetical protein